MNDLDKLYLQKALHKLNVGAWYSWKKTNDDGSKIPNSERMQYKYLVKIIDSATMPTEAELNAEIQELKDAEANAETKKASGKQKLRDLGLDDAEIKALIGV
jgi:type II secretory pathway component HofQ